MIIAMAGLPGTGKTTLAKQLAEKMPAILLNKDEVRSALFSQEIIEYSNRQDDFVISIMVQVADYHIKNDISSNIILDGRTFMKKKQVDDLVEYCHRYNWNLRVIYCACSDDIARARLDRDIAVGSHLAANRDIGLYSRLKSKVEKLEIPHLHVDTGEPFEKCVRLCLDYLNTDPEK